MPSLTALLPEGDSIVGSPTEVYTRVARGVLTCWFGAAGPLKSTHIYHAEADPASKGGKSEIEIFRKDPTAPDPRSLRAYRILIQPSGSSSTKVEVENLTIDEPLASRLGSDVSSMVQGRGRMRGQPGNRRVGRPASTLQPLSRRPKRPSRSIDSRRDPARAASNTKTHERAVGHVRALNTILRCRPAAQTGAIDYPKPIVADRTRCAIRATSAPVVLNAGCAQPRQAMLIDRTLP